MAGGDCHLSPGLPVGRSKGFLLLFYFPFQRLLAEEAGSRAKANRATSEAAACVLRKRSDCGAAEGPQLGPQMGDSLPFPPLSPEARWELGADLRA